MEGSVDRDVAEVQSDDPVVAGDRLGEELVEDAGGQPLRVPQALVAQTTAPDAEERYRS